MGRTGKFAADYPNASFLKLSCTSILPPNLVGLPRVPGNAARHYDVMMA